MTLEIKSVQHLQDMTKFIKIPSILSVYKAIGMIPDPDSIHNYNPALNPVHKHLKTNYFVAEKNHLPVGRIAAIKDQSNPDPNTGLFGCFECEQDIEIASALINAARQWLLDNGCMKMIGPATFNTNQQVGLLIEGHESGPQIMLPYNPPCYQQLLEQSGLTKHTDLLTFSWKKEMGIPTQIARISKRVRRLDKVAIKKLTLINLHQDALLIQEMFNRIMSDNWGFIPLTLEESMGMVTFCRMHADRDLLLSAWIDGKPVGILLFLPTSLTKRNSSKTVRAAILGVVPEYRNRGVDSYVIEHSLQIMMAKGYEQADISLIHEENKIMIKIVSQVFGAAQTRRYRVYIDEGLRP